MRPPKNKWPDFLITIAVRLFFGALFGAIGAFFLGAMIIIRMRGRAASTVSILNHWGESRTNLAIVAWFVIGAVIGAIAAVCNIPEWQTPWFKSEFDEELERREALKKSATTKEKD